MSPAGATRTDPKLARAAKRHGVATEYTDAGGTRRRVEDTTLATVLELLGDPTPRGDLPPVIVAWDGALAPIDGSLLGHDREHERKSELEHERGRSAGQRTERRHRPGMPVELRGEDGADLGRLAPQRDRAGSPDRAGSRAGSMDGAGSRAGSMVLGEPLPYGVHELLAGGVRIAYVVSAPSRAGGRLPGEALSATPGGGTGGAARPWGVFAPVHAIRDRRGRAAGDISALESLGEMIGGLGGSAIATLPLLAEHATADGALPGQHPYSPLSRMFWNEAYLDVSRIPELARSATAAATSASASGTGEPSGPNARGQADLASLASAARPALDAAVQRLWLVGGERLDAFRTYLAARPEELARYARFRAAAEKAGAELSSWPASWRAGRIGADEVSRHAELRHQFAQWAMDEQLARTAAALERRGVGLVMDLPIGCSAGGYDPWAFPDAYARGASLGAPPDSFFTAGQNWGFPPPHPETDRRDGYRVLHACLAHSMQHASVLRVDHVLGWSRLWWVPDGNDADAGAYVTYPLEELLAVASLEAWRHSARLVGEDLGTVQRGLRTKLRSHDIAGMRVAVFELGLPARRLRPAAGMVAYVDTHDTATFAGWCSGADIDQRVGLGLLTEADARAERAGRAEARDATVRRLLRARALEPGEASDAVGILGALLAELGASPAELVLATLEDLWGELDPQNVPGTTTEHENFSRRFALTLEELAGDTRAIGALRRLDGARRTAPRRPS